MIRTLQVLLFVVLVSCSGEKDTEHNTNPINDNPDSVFQHTDTISEIVEINPCDIIYDTITQENYIMHRSIMRVFSDTSVRNYLYDQDVSALVQYLDPDEDSIHHILSNRVIFLMLENSIEHFDFGLTIWHIPDENFDYFFEHISNPICNNLPIDSIISIVQSDYNCHNEESEKLKARTIKHLEIALENMSLSQ